MDLVNGVLNWVGTPAMVASLLLFYPPYYLFKTCYSFLSWLFPEDLAGKVVLITGASSGIGEVTPTVCRLLTVNYSSTTDIMQSHKLKRGLLFFTCSDLLARFATNFLQVFTYVPHILFTVHLFNTL
jgi:hypothetical protein